MMNDFEASTTHEVIELKAALKGLTELVLKQQDLLHNLTRRMEIQEGNVEGCP